MPRFIAGFSDVFRGSGRSVNLLIDAPTEKKAREKFMKYLRISPKKESCASYPELWEQLVAGDDEYSLRPAGTSSGGVEVIFDECITLHG